MESFDCTVIGDVFIDLIVQFNGSYDHIVRGGTSYCESARVELGGSGNVAVGLSMIGGRTAFVGRVGDDLFGKLYLKDLEEKRVVAKTFCDKHLTTGLVLVFVEEGRQRSFLVFRGANDCLSPKEISEASSLIKRSVFLYVSGYSLVNDPQRSAILEAVDLARKFKTKIVFDPGAYNLVRSRYGLFAELSSLCDVFTPNLEEALALTGSASLNDSIDSLREMIPLTALKCGQDGCVLITKEKILRVPNRKVTCADPTGAGDAFTAAVIYGLSRDLPLRFVGELANWFAAKVVAGTGARSFPTREETESFLRRLRARIDLQYEATS